MEGPSNIIPQYPSHPPRLESKVQSFDLWTMNTKPFLIPRKVVNGYTPFVLLFEVSMYHPRYKDLVDYIFSFMEQQELKWGNGNIVVLDERNQTDNIWNPYLSKIDWYHHQEVDNREAFNFISKHKGVIVFTDDHSILPPVFTSFSIGCLTEKHNIEPLLSRVSGMPFRTRVEKIEHDKNKLIGIVRGISKWNTFSTF
jgi:hypothetical protein